MNVLTYVDGILTIIRDSDFYKGADTKPSFITGSNFYYEPTLKTMDGVALTDTQITDAEAFITAFAFPTPVPPPQPKHCVDTDGNYIGLAIPDVNYHEVPTAPTLETEKWNGSAWVDSVLIDKTTKFYRGVGDTRTAPDTQYAPNTIGTTPFALTNYLWNGTAWTISLEDAKSCKKNGLKEKQTIDLNALLGTTASGETTSFTTQESEARAWSIDNNAVTPFIDALLLAREQSETKQDLVSTIIANADAYTVAYGNILGKFQKLIKQVDTCTTVAEVEAIVWA